MPKTDEVFFCWRADCCEPCRVRNFLIVDTAKSPIREILRCFCMENIKHTLPVLRWLPFAILHREKAISDGKNSVFCSKLPYRAKIFLFQTGNFQITESIDGKDICGYDLRYTGSNLVGDLSQVTG